MKKGILLVLGSILLLTFPIKAQENLPGFWNIDSTRIRRNEMTQLYLSPKQVLWTDGHVENTEILLSLKSGQPDMAREPYCLMATEGDTASILLDYGRELHGGLKLVLGHCNAATSHVRIRFGESIGEVCSEPDGGRNRTGFGSNDHATRDMNMPVPRYGMMEIGNTGFRFVRIDLIGHERKIQLKEASAILRYRDIPYIGSFCCSDKRLTEIWQTGAYTVHLNMQEYLWDGIKRDRAVWLGDMHPEVATLMSVFGQNEVVPRTLDLACQFYPLPQWQNGISAYSFWYLIIHYEWYLHGGDNVFLAKHCNYIKGLIDKIDGLVDSNGNENFEGNTKGVMRYFLDWQSTYNPRGAEAGHRALACWALTAAEALCHIMGEDEYAKKCTSTIERLKKQIKPHNGLKQAASLMAISGMIPAKQACDEVVAKGGAAKFSTFYGYYMLEALAMAGEYQQALDIIRQYWGAMIDLGATTFWEDFNLEWTKNAARIDEFATQDKIDIHRNYGDHCYISYRHSLCHGWASGPTAWLTRHVLGVKIVEPGCRTLHITPYLGNLDWAEGSFPTPFGTVYIRHQKTDDGIIVSKIIAPENIRIIQESE